MCAATTGNVDLLLMLLDCGADSTLIDENEETAFDLADASSSSECISALNERQSRS